MTSIDIDRLAELRGERGLSYAACARLLGMSVGAVSWQCLKHGIEKPGTVFRPAPRRPGSVTRSGHVVRLFTPDEDAQLLEWSLAGLSATEVGRRLGRKHNSIIGRLMTLARRDERAGQ